MDRIENYFINNKAKHQLQLETLCADCYNGRQTLVWEKVSWELDFYENVLRNLATTYFSG